MAEGKKSFMLYADMIGVFEKLPDDKAGQLIKHIFRYVNDQNPETDDLILNVAFEPIKTALKRDLRSWWEKCEKNRENINKRWNKNNTTVYDRIPSDTKHTDSDNDSDTDRDSDTEKDKYNIKLIVDFLNQNIGTAFRESSEKTKSLIKARLREGFTVHDFETVIIKKRDDWMNDAKMRTFLRPETLFGTKFESYFNETKIKKTKSQELWDAA